MAVISPLGDGQGEKSHFKATGEGQRPTSSLAALLTLSWGQPPCRHGCHGSGKLQTDQRGWHCPTPDRASLRCWNALPSFKWVPWEQQDEEWLKLGFSDCVDSVRCLGRQYTQQGRGANWSCKYLPFLSISCFHFYIYFCIFLICTPILQLLVLCEPVSFQTMFLWLGLFPTPTLFFLLSLVSVAHVPSVSSSFLLYSLFLPFSIPSLLYYLIINICSYKNFKLHFPRLGTQVLLSETSWGHSWSHRCLLAYVSTRAVVKSLCLYSSQHPLSIVVGNIEPHK